MENGKMPAFQTSIGMSDLEIKQMGLTKREYIATQLLSGLLANEYSWEFDSKFEKLAKEAVKQTDTLLKALSKS